MKKSIYISFLLIMVASSCKVSSEVFQDRKEPLNRAPAAVSGKVIEKVNLYETYTPYRTKYVFKVYDIIKGDTIGEIITLLSESGTTRNGSEVASTSDYNFKVGEEYIVLLYPVTQLDPQSKWLNEMYGKYLVDYDIPYQFTSRYVIKFKNGKTAYTKPKVRMSKMVKLMKKYLADPNRVVPPMQMRPD